MITVREFVQKLQFMGVYGLNFGNGIQNQNVIDQTWGPNLWPWKNAEMMALASRNFIPIFTHLCMASYGNTDLG
jgi:hypothetical protein